MSKIERFFDFEVLVPQRPPCGVRALMLGESSNTDAFVAFLMSTEVRVFFRELFEWFMENSHEPSADHDTGVWTN